MRAVAIESHGLDGHHDNGVAPAGFRDRVFAAEDWWRRITRPSFGRREPEEVGAGPVAFLRFKRNASVITGQNSWLSDGRKNSARKRKRA